MTQQMDVVEDAKEGKGTGNLKGRQAAEGEE